MRIEAIFFDRDGVINEDLGYVCTPERLKIIDGFLEFFLGVDKEIKKFIVTNQAGIARSFYSVDEHKSFMCHMLGVLEKMGVYFTDWRFCPHHPEFTGLCACRKPAPGMLEDLIKQYNLKPQNCVFIGDKETDVLAGINAGLGFNILFRGSEEAKKSLIESDIKFYIADSFAKVHQILDKI